MSKCKDRYEHRSIDARKISVLGAQERGTVTINESLSTTESTLVAEGKGLDGLPTTSVVGRKAWEAYALVVISTVASALLVMSLTVAKNVGSWTPFLRRVQLESRNEAEKGSSGNFS